MPGANYMGGRRNTMKARAKDTIGRQQKSHFGRQRLDLLSRGIAALKPSELALAIPTSTSLHKPSAQDIALAHAQARMKLPLSAAGSAAQSYIPPARALRAPVRSPGSGKTRSALCDALDMSDPVFMRGIMDEILAMPDLAGLVKRGRKSRTPPASADRQDAAHSMRSSQTGSSYRSLKRRKGNSGRNIYSQSESVESEQERTRPKDPSPPNFSPDSRSSLERSVHDSGFSEYDFYRIPQASSISSPAWSTRLAESSPRTMLGNTIPADEWTMDWQDNHQIQPDAYTDDSDTEEIPSVIDFGKLGHGRYRYRCIYGALFEQDDPWRAIGVILGIEEDRDTDVCIPPEDLCDFADTDYSNDVDEIPGEYFYKDEETAFSEQLVEDESIEDESYTMDWDCPVSALSRSENLAEQRSRSPLLAGRSEDVEDAAIARMAYEPGDTTPPPASPAFAEEVCIDELVDDIATVADEEGWAVSNEGRVLEVAALDEIDGRFVGPALFGEECMSDSE